MALYVSAGTRRRRLILTAVATAIVGLVAGLVVGRASVTTPAERARSVKASAGDLATRIDALSIEYEQALTGSEDSVAKGVAEPMREIRAEVVRALNGAPWVGPPRRAALLRAIDGVTTAAQAKVPLAVFEQVSSAASSSIRTTLGAT